jgi:hypothetical protein
MVDTTTTDSDEIYAGSNICDNPNGTGHTLLCSSNPCDTNACTNALDYMERSSSGGDPGGPACATFSGGPIDTTSYGTSDSTHRTSYLGEATTWFASDWTTAPETL